jgi:ubiquinone/menaquinone biosynthesis C-methylase UbiE
MEVTEIKRIYAYYSRVYDFIFKRWFFPRQRHAIASLQIDPGQHILDVGVGTGFFYHSIPSMPTSLEWTYRVKCSRKPTKKCCKSGSHM